MKNRFPLLVALVLCSFPLRTPAASGELVGSFNLQVQTSSTNQTSAANLATRILGGNADTQGLVAGTASFLAGHTPGQDNYNGVQLSVDAGSVSFDDMTRYGGTAFGGVVFWDFDLSAWAAGKDIGTGSNQVGLAIQLDYDDRRTSGTFEAPLFISYNNGSSLTRDTTVTTSQSPGSGTTYGLVSDTAHFVPIGAVPAGPPGNGTFSIDITPHLLASTDQVVRIALFVTEYLGDIALLNNSGLVETNWVPVTSMTSWHDWDASNLSAITMANGSGGFTTDVAFDGSHSLRFDYGANSAITFPYRYAGNSIYNGGLFFASLFDPDATSDETYLIEFIDNGVVESTITLNPARPFWNRCEVDQVERNEKFSPVTPVGLQIDAYIPSDPDAIRIIPPQGRAGTVYIGKLFLGTDSKKAELGLQADLATAPIAATLPETPAEVTTAQSNNLAQIRTRLDEIYNVAPYTAVASIPTATIDDLRARHQAYNIQWDGTHGIWSGNNPMMYEGVADWRSNEQALGNLMLEVAAAYRNSGSAAQQTELKQIYFELFDFSECIGGTPDDWSAGKPYLPAIFLMRAEMESTGRLTPSVLDTYRKRIGFERVYLEESWYAQTGIGWNPAQSSRDLYRAGELGENVDYLRIISIQLIMHAALNASNAEYVRDLQAVSDFFSNIALQIGPGTIDGFRPDGLAYHHWGWVTQYYTSCLEVIPRIIYALADTEFRISEEAHILVRHALAGLDWLSLYSIVPNTLSGKGGFPYAFGGNTHHTPDPYAYLALSGTPDGTQITDPEMAGLFLRSYNDFLPNEADPSAFSSNSATQISILGYTPSLPPAGTRIYSYGNMASHRKNGWLWTLKGHSKFQYTRESSDPWVTYLGHGMLDLVSNYWVRFGATKLENEFGANGYDWRKFPGTTTIDFSDIQSIVNQEYKRWWQDETFVGGVVQGGNGLFTMRIKGSAANGLGSYRAKKSWFFFDGSAVAMGSGISNSVSGEPTITTLYQDEITSATPTYFNSTTGTTGLVTDTTSTLVSPAWMVDSQNTGYWVPAGSSLTVKRRNQTNPDWDNNASVTGDFALAWLNHGSAPASANYWYVQTAASTPAGMSAFNEAMNGATPAFQALERTDKVHAVWSEAQQSYGIVVFDNSSAVNVRDVKTVSRPCALMVHESSATTRTLSMADPDLDLLDHTVYSNNESWGVSQPHTVTIVLNGLWHIATPPANMTTVTTDHALNSTTIAVVVEEGLTTDLDLVAMTADNSFGLWLDSHGIGTASTTADSDSDGMADIHEYAFNMNPAVSDRHTLAPGTGTSGLPFFEVDTGATPMLNVIYLRRKDAIDLTYSVEFTGNLAPDLWTTATVPETITPIDSIWEQVEVGDNDAPANASSRFGRVRFGYIPIP